jgi:hypothetical protein
MTKHDGGGRIDPLITSSPAEGAISRTEQQTLFLPYFPVPVFPEEERREE